MYLLLYKASSHPFYILIFQNPIADYDEDPQVDDLEGGDDDADEDEEEEADGVGEGEVELGSQDTDEDEEVGEDEGM